MIHFPAEDGCCESGQNKQDLKIQFEDDFTQDLDPNRWVSLPVAPEDGGGLGKVTAVDGNLMDVVDITGFVSSTPQALKDGAYVTIGGGGSSGKHDSTWIPGLC